MKVTPKRLLEVGGRCHWCHGCMSLDVGESHPDRATIDHVKCKGECSTYDEYKAKENMVIACHRCNQRRNAVFITARYSMRQPLHAEWDKPKDIPPKTPRALIAQSKVSPKRAIRGPHTSIHFDPIVLAKRQDTVFARDLQSIL